MKALQKLRARRGFSLAELLVSVAILGFMSSMAVMGVSQALRQRNQSIALADAQTVTGTVAQIITDELRYGRIAGVTSDDTILLDSGVYGYPLCMGLDADGYLVSRGVTFTDAGSGVTFGALGVIPGREYRLLGADAYCGMRLSKLEFTVKTDGAADQVSAVDVSMAMVSDSDSTTELWSLDFSVTPLNQQLYQPTKTLGLG